MKNSAPFIHASRTAKPFPDMHDEQTAQPGKTFARGIGTGAIAASMATSFREEKLGIRVCGPSATETPGPGTRRTTPRTHTQ